MRSSACGDKKKKMKLIMKFCEVQNQHLFTQLLLSAPSRHALEIFFQMGENKPFFKKYSWVQLVGLTKKRPAARDKDRH